MNRQDAKVAKGQTGSQSVDERFHVTRSWRIALGFDVGRLRIGVAVGDGLTGSARPLCVLPVRQHRPDWDAIARLIAEWRPDGLVVGVPRHADETANAMTHTALRFSRQLQGRFRLPVATVDERLSSWEAEQRLAMTGRRRKAAESVDAQAAAVILESGFNSSPPPQPSPARGEGVSTPRIPEFNDGAAPCATRNC